MELKRMEVEGLVRLHRGIIEVLKEPPRRERR